MIFETFKIALKSIWANKSRSSLTILGLVIGIGSVVIFIAIGDGVKNDIRSEINNLGSNIVMIIGGDVDPQNQSLGFSTNLLTQDILNQDDIDNLDTINSIADIAVISLVAGLPRYESKTASNALFAGASPSLINILTGFEIDKGRFFTAQENLDKERVIVLGPSVAENLFEDQNPIGKEVSVGDENFEVIGVTKVPDSASLFGTTDFSIFTLIPHMTASDIQGESIFRVFIKVEESIDTETAIPEIRQALLKNHTEDEFSILTQEDLESALDSILGILTTAIAGIAAISLVVAGVGIMNIMLVSVTERTKEIGIRKAVGATTSAILWQFLVEAITLSSIGSLIAIGLAISITKIIAEQTIINPIVTTESIFLAVSVGALVGLVFGITPALRAAKLDPIQALRSD